MTDPIQNTPQLKWKGAEERSRQRLPELRGLVRLANVAETFSVEQDHHDPVPIDPAITKRAALQLEVHRLIVVVAGDHRTTYSALREIVSQSHFAEWDKKRIVFKTQESGDDIQLDLLGEPEPGRTADRPMLLVVDATSDYAFNFVSNVEHCVEGTLSSLVEASHAWHRYVLIGLAEPGSPRSLEAFEQRRICFRIARAAEALPPPSAAVDKDRWRWSDERSPLERIALFVAAFFPDIPAEEFDALVRLFAGDTTEEAPAPADPSKPASPPRKLVERWKAERSSVLRRCGLSYALEGRESEGPCVSFPAPDVAGEVRGAVMSHDYLHYAENVQLIEERGILFAASPRLAERVTTVLTDAVERSPGVRGTAAIAHLVSAAKAATGSAPDPREAPLRPEFGDAVRSSVRAHVLNRIAQLVMALAERSHLDEAATLVLRQLMEHGCHSAVLELSRRLRGMPGFDFFSWLRRLLDEGDEATRNAARRELYDRMRWDSPQARTTLELVCGWMAEDPKGSSGKAQSARGAAAALVADLCEASVLDPEGSGGALVHALGQRGARGERDRAARTFWAAVMGPWVNNVARSRFGTDFSLEHFVALWLLPPDPAALPVEVCEELFVKCDEAIEQAKGRAGGLDWDGQWLFQAMFLTEWVTRAEVAGGADAAAALVESTGAALDGSDDGRRSARVALGVYCAAIDDSVKESLRVIAEQQATTAEERRSRRAARVVLEGRRRSARALRRRLASRR